MNAEDIETAGCKRSATEACIVTEKFRYKRPPLPSPLLQRRRGNSNNSPVTKLRCYCFRTWNLELLEAASTWNNWPRENHITSSPPHHGRHRPRALPAQHESIAFAFSDSSRC